MSREELHDAAQADTPASVEIPNTTNGLILWLLGRFGVAVAFAAATYFVYQDMRSDRKELFEAYRQNTEVIRDFKNTIENQGRQFEELRRTRTP